MEALELFRRLLGTWQGSGHGQFPTIDSFRYEETLRFEAREGVAAIHYHQSTSLLLDGGGKEPSHWESGFLLPQEDGSIHLLNSQESARTEVLVGRARALEEGVELKLESTSHAHDPRMRASTRTYRLRGDVLRYEVRMATDQVPELQLHLEATLARGSATL